MKKVSLVVLLALGACTAAQTQQAQTALSSPAGQLFCQIATPTGQIVAPLIDTAATAYNPALGAAAVIVTGALASDAQKACQQAAANVGGTTGVPVSPPPASTPAAPVAVAVPASSTLTEAPTAK
jgi:hypothetical protein